MFKNITKKLPIDFTTLAAVTFGGAIVAFAVTGAAVTSPVMVIAMITAAAWGVSALISPPAPKSNMAEFDLELERFLALSLKDSLDADKKQDNTQSAKNIHASDLSVSEEYKPNKLGAMYEKGIEKTPNGNQSAPIKKKRQFNELKR